MPCLGRGDKGAQVDTRMIPIVHVDKVRRGAGQERRHDAMALPLAIQVLIPLLVSDLLSPDL